MSLQTIRAVVAYDGTDFCGWQRNDGLETVCGALEAACELVFKRRTVVVAAGRTDAGVHATAQVVSLTIPASFPLARFCVAVNNLLPDGVSVHAPARVADDWSARFRATERRYVYLLHNAPEPDGLRRRYFGYVPRRLDVAAMRIAAAGFPGLRDFRAFCGTPPDNGNTVRELRGVTIEGPREDVLRFRLRADGFVHRMVRIIVGTLIEVGERRRDPLAIDALFAGRNRRASGRTAPAAGLYLAGVSYPDYAIDREPWPIEGEGAAIG